jgi:hypothetical protein
MTKVAVLAALLATVPSNHVGLERPASEADLLRGFAFARCLEKGYERTPFAEDAGRVADLYFQMGKLAKSEAYDQMTKLAESQDAAKPSVMGHHNFAIMACLEFYESPKLKQFAQKAAARPAGKR